MPIKIDLLYNTQRSACVVHKSDGVESTASDLWSTQQSRRRGPTSAWSRSLSICCTKQQIHTKQIEVMEFGLADLINLAWLFTRRESGRRQRTWRTVC